LGNKADLVDINYVNMDGLYSLENARKFKWSSISGNLNPERLSHLENYLVGKKILDAGCGGGAYVEFLSGKGLEVTGVDKSEKFLQLAKQQRLLGTYLQADLTNLPFQDKAFDCTYCFDVLEHIDDRFAVDELVRVTNKRIIIAVPKHDEVMSKFNLTFLHYQDKTHLRNYTEDYLRNLFTRINYADITIFPELAVPGAHLVQEMIEFGLPDTGLKYVYRKTLNFVLKELLNRSYYKQIYTGLVIVIDLMENKKV
jgi:ubiquinone/menaquinone biosynthesis C-methylase UbiE